VRVKKVRGSVPLTSVLSLEGRGKSRYRVFTGVAIFDRGSTIKETISQEGK
jgi:hypothetical protein